MKSIITGLLSFSILFSFAQTDSTSNHHRSNIQLNTSYFLGSNAIQADFIKTLYKGQVLLNADKSEVSAELKDMNNIGFVNSNQLKYEGNEGTLFKSFYPTVAITENLLFSSKFTRDLFRLTFYGNSVYEEQTAIISGSSINVNHFQTFDIGLGKKGEKTVFNAYLGFVKGSQNVSLNLNAGQVYTAPYGEFIDIALNGSLVMSDTSDVSLFAFNGSGFNFGFDLTHAINEKSKLKVKVDQIGLIQWQNSSQFQVDSTFHFEGITIDNIFEIQDSVFTQESNIDTIVSAYSTSQNSYRSYLPASFAINYLMQLNKVNLNIGIDHRINADYNIHYQGKAMYQATESTSAGLVLGSGGYTNFHYGISLKHQTNLFQVELGANALSGYLYGRGKNQSAYIRLKYFL